MFGLVDLRLSFSERVPTAPIQGRLANLRPALELVPPVMRQGEGSVDDQHRRQSTLLPNGRILRWPRTRSFGNSKPGPTGLVRSGRYMAAWMGGVGGYTSVGSRSVSIGVSPSAFPQEPVLQADSPTAIRVTPKMRVYLGLNKGVWLRKSTTHLMVPPRAFRPNPAMIRRARQLVLNYVINGTPVEYRPAA